MDKIIIILITLILGFSKANGQQIETKIYQVVDANTHLPLAFSTIKIKYKNQGMYSDNGGYFDPGKIEKNDTLSVSHIGYKTKDISYSEITGPIELYPEIYTIPPVSISSKRSQKKIPYLKKKDSFGWYWSRPIVYATKIRFPDAIAWDDKLILNIKLRLKYKNGIADNPCRLHIYEPDKNGKPGKEMLTKNIFLSGEKVHFNRYAIDLSAYNIRTNASEIFVGVEWMGNNTEPNGNSERIGAIMTRASQETLTYIKWVFTGDNEWKPLNNMPFDEPGVNPPNMMLSLIYK